ncbi:MAG: transketolase family protein [Candidatus Dormibacteria bacterium]
MKTMRERMVDELGAQLDQHANVVVVLAAISAALFEPARREHPDRVVNVGIREQALIGVTAGLAAAGMRPVAHTFAPFLVERGFEQLKLDLCHQQWGAVLVSIGGSYDTPQYGRTHFCPEDVALLDTLPGIEVHVPGHPDEAAALLRHAIAGTGVVYVRLSEASNRNPQPIRPGRMLALHSGSRGTVIAIGPMLDPVVEALGDMDVTLLYAASVRPFDAETLLAYVSAPAIVVVEPYLAGTSVPFVTGSLAHIPHRAIGLGVGRADLHRYGTRRDHDRAHGLEAPSLRAQIDAFLETPPT